MPRAAKTIAAIVAVTATCAVLLGCAVGMDDQSATVQRPLAIMDAYLIASGMAASYASMPEADPAVVTQLARLDMRAADAVRRLARRPDADPSATVQAVSALTDYAAAQAAAEPATATR